MHSQLVKPCARVGLIAVGRPWKHCGSRRGKVPDVALTQRPSKNAPSLILTPGQPAPTLAYARRVYRAGCRAAANLTALHQPRGGHSPWPLLKPPRDHSLGRREGRGVGFRSAHQDCPQCIGICPFWPSDLSSAQGSPPSSCGCPGYDLPMVHECAEWNCTKRRRCRPSGLPRFPGTCRSQSERRPGPAIRWRRALCGGIPKTRS